MNSGHPGRELDNLDSPQELREALHAAHTARPSSERLLATRAALLERAGGATAGAGGATAGAGMAGAGAGALGGAGTAASTSAGAPAAPLGAGKLLLGALTVAVVSGALVWNARPKPTAPTPASPAASAAAVAPAEPSSELQAAAPEEATSPPRADPQPTGDATREGRTRFEPEERSAAPEAAAAAPQRAKGRRAPRRKSAARAKPSPQVDPGEEVALLSAARDALQDHPAQTLRLTSEHEQLFPQGAFVQEREVLAVHALLRRGERERALQRGGQFLARYPRSTHARRVARLLEEASR